MHATEAEKLMKLYKTAYVEREAHNFCPLNLESRAPLSQCRHVMHPENMDMEHYLQHYK
jgi:hypothetical protein